MKLQTEFNSRDELIAYLHATFPDAAAHSPEIADTRGGRRAAETALQQIKPERYAATRNHLNGTVTRLAVTEFAWRDYWQRVYAQIGNGIWKDRESLKTGWRPADYADKLPDDIAQGTTGLRCMDSFADELRTTGYLHNHARMWLAAYVVHWRRIRWQAGAAWFLTHLLDGDPASNNLSWQWVASAFAVKPYFFNRDNLEQFTDGVYCRDCQHYRNGCPFEATSDELSARLFPRANQEAFKR
jgi:deoxyribodipyrimidine photo-lyase